MLGGASGPKPAKQAQAWSLGRQPQDPDNQIDPARGSGRQS